MNETHRWRNMHAIWMAIAEYKAMLRPRLRPLLYTGVLLSGVTAVAAGERLEYTAEIKSALTLNSWVNVGTAELTARDLENCPGGGECRETRLWVSSEGTSSWLESAYPLRYLYISVMRPEERTTLYYEEIRRRRKANNPGDYHWRHRVVWLQGENNELSRFDLGSEGSDLPENVAPWITHEMADGMGLKVRNSRKFPASLPTLDRWGAFSLLTTLPLQDGATWKLSGTSSKVPLTFSVRVEGKEMLSISGKARETWRVRIDEIRIDGKRSDPVPLFAWIATDNARTPVRFTMDHDIGNLRLTLK